MTTETEVLSNIELVSIIAKVLLIVAVFQTFILLLVGVKNMNWIWNSVYFTVLGLTFIFCILDVNLHDYREKK